MGYEGTVKILSYLSKMLNGNIDLIEFIYQKKKIIEMNENLLYYLLLGLQTEKLYSYTIFSIDNAGPPSILLSTSCNDSPTRYSAANVELTNKILANNKVFRIFLITIFTSLLQDLE